MDGSKILPHGFGCQAISVGKHREFVGVGPRAFPGVEDGQLPLHQDAQIERVDLLKRRGRFQTCPGMVVWGFRHRRRGRV